MRIKVFIEYTIKSETESQFRSLINELRDELSRWGIERFKLFEGTDQPFLVVEECYVPDLDTYEKIKADRKAESSAFWKKLHRCIQGGVEKVHIWAFQEIET